MQILQFYLKFIYGKIGVFAPSNLGNFSKNDISHRVKLLTSQGKLYDFTIDIKFIIFQFVCVLALSQYLHDFIVR